MLCSVHKMFHISQFTAIMGPKYVHSGILMFVCKYDVKTYIYSIVIIQRFQLCCLSLGIYSRAHSDSCFTVDTSLKGLCHEISFPDFVREYCQYKLVLAFKGIRNFGNIFEHCFQTFTRRSVVFTLIIKCLALC